MKKWSGCMKSVNIGLPRLLYFIKLIVICAVTYVLTTASILFYVNNLQVLPQPITVYSDVDESWEVENALEAWALDFEVVDTKNADIRFVERELPYWMAGEASSPLSFFGLQIKKCTVELNSGLHEILRGSTTIHELGHCLGLGHTEEYDSIMRSWVSLEDNVMGPSENDLARLAERYG
jgi:hypothetical protein